MHSWLAALGAMITILASLLDFFMQQLIYFQDCLQRDESTVASISKTNNYNASDGPVFNITSDTYLPMIAAINNAIVGPTEDFTNVLSRGCATCNCTFPVDNRASFSTLAVGHKYEDVTPDIKVRYTNETTKYEDGE